LIITEDIIKEKGPMGGIHAGLNAISKEKGFFVACDMPFLHSGLIKRLIAAAQESDADCIIPRGPRGVEPLHAVYDSRVIPTIEELLGGDDFSMRHLLKRCECRYVKASGDEEKSFININTPEELEEISGG